MRPPLLAVLAITTLLAGCSKAPDKSDQVNAELLLSTTASWDGTPYQHYPEGKPMLSLMKVSVPANTSLDWHCHPSFSLGYLLAGKLEVETTTGKRITLSAGDSLAEVVDEVHRGHTAAEPATIIMFHAGIEHLPLSVPQAHCERATMSGDVPMDIGAGHQPTRP